MRAFIRHPSDIPIEIHVQEEQSHHLSHLQNVSYGGLCCDSEHHLADGCMVVIRIQLNKCVEIEGRVVWCHEQAKGFKVGIAFLRPDDAFEARMVEQICHIEHYKKKVHEEEGRELTGEEAALEWIDKYASEFPNPD